MTRPIKSCDVIRSRQTGADAINDELCFFEEHPVMDDLQAWRQQCRMRPYPLGLFEKFPGPPHRVGQLINAFHVFCATNAYIGQHWSILQFIYRRLMYRIFCTFEPYSEDQIFFSIDVYYRRRDRSRRQNIQGPYYQFYCMSISSGLFASTLPMVRPVKAGITTFSRNGRYIAWPCNNFFSIYDRQHSQTYTRCMYYLCSSFSPCSSMIAFMKCYGANFTVDIFLSNSTYIIESIQMSGASWMYTPRFHDFNIQWSRCGNYIGITYRGSLKVINFSPECGSSQHLVMPMDVGYQASLASPQAFDFRSVDRDRRSAHIAFASGKNEIFLFHHDQQGLGSRVATCPPLSTARRLVTNCLCFSNGEDVLAVALSSAEIFLLHSSTLDVLISLQSGPVEARYFRGFTSVNFSCSDCYLTTGASDGFIRVWCVKQIDSLKRLCRQAIRCLCTMDNMRHLPLPTSSLEYLTDISF